MSRAKRSDGSIVILSGSDVIPSSSSSAEESSSSVESSSSSEVASSSSSEVASSSSSEVASSSSSEVASSSSSEEPSSSSEEPSSSSEEPSSSSAEASSSSSESSSSSSEVASSSSEEESSSSSEEASSSSEDSSSGESSSSSEESSSSSAELESSSSSSEQSVYSSFDVTNTGVTLFDSNINLSDYQYNTDGLDAQVLPVGYSAVSGTGDSIRLSNYTGATGSIAIADNGTLYIKNPIDSQWSQINTDTTWTKVSGIAYTTSGVEYAYGIKAGGLYSITMSADYYEVTIMRIGSASDWTDISGYSVSSSGQYCWAFGIRAGRLYSLSGNTATQIGSATNWSSVTGFAYYEDLSSGGTTHTKEAWAYAIANGSLFKIYVDGFSIATVQIGSASDWSFVSGYYSREYTNDGYAENQTVGTAFGIRGGMLYELATLTEIGDAGTGWYFILYVGINEAVGIRTGDYSSYGY